MTSGDLLAELRARAARGMHQLANLEWLYARRVLMEAFADYREEYECLRRRPHGEATPPVFDDIAWLFPMHPGEARPRGPTSDVTAKQTELLREHCLPIPLPDAAQGKGGKPRRGFFKGQFRNIAKQMVKEKYVGEGTKSYAYMYEHLAIRFWRMRDERAVWDAVRVASHEFLAKLVLRLYWRADNDTKAFIFRELGAQIPRSKRGRPPAKKKATR